MLFFTSRHSKCIVHDSKSNNRYVIRVIFEKKLKFETVPTSLAPFITEILLLKKKSSFINDYIFIKKTLSYTKFSVETICFKMAGKVEIF